MPGAWEWRIGDAAGADKSAGLPTGDGLAKCRAAKWKDAYQTPTSWCRETFHLGEAPFSSVPRALSV